MDETEDTITIRIPKNLYSRILEKIKGTSYRSVDDYIVEKMMGEFPLDEEFTEEERKEIEKRLRNLGYIE